MRKILLFSIFVSLLVLPQIGYSQDVREAPEWSIFGEDGVIDKITNILFSLLVFGSAIMFLYAGWLFITSSGDPQKFETAKKAVVYGIIGLIIAFSARGIVKLIDEIFYPEVP